MPLVKRPLLVSAAMVAGLVLALVCPVPYWHTVGYDLVVKSGDRPHRLHLGAIGAAAAERRAQLVKKLVHADVTVEPVRARSWGTVYAMVEDRLKIAVDTDGKSDAEVEKEIAEQLAAAGWDAQVHVGSADGWSTLEITADDGHGQKMQIIRQAAGQDSKRIELPLADDAKAIKVRSDHPIADDELKAQIEAQLAARGVTGATVTVTNGKVNVEMEQPAPAK